MFSISSVGLLSPKLLRDEGPLHTGQLEQTKELLLERILFAICCRVLQQTHYMVGGREIQYHDHMIIFHQVHCDSTEMKQCLDMLEPRVQIMLPKVRKIS